MPAVLDVAIGTVFVFLLFSLVVSSLNEYILSLLDKRAKFLRLGLAEMFGKAAIKNVNTNKKYLELSADGERLLSHGLINAFSRSDSGGTSPSYIPAGAFVTALLDVIGGQGNPLTSIAGQISVTKSFLAGLQGARPAEGDTTSFASFDTVVSAFDTACAALAAAPGPGSSLALLQEKAAVARLRAKAQLEILAATDIPAAQAIIDLPTNSSLKGELDALIQKNLHDHKAFQATVTEWFALDDSRNSLELAAITALADFLRTTAGHTGAALEAGINSLENQKLKEGLLSLYRGVDGDLQNFKTAVEGWFNSSMDRVGGWYKRYAQKWMIGLGFILAATFNVDSIQLVRDLSYNPKLAEVVADQAATYVSSEEKPLNPEELAARREERIAAVKKAEDDLKALTDAKETDKAKVETAIESVNKARAEANALENYQAAVSRLTGAGIPIGWTPAVRTKLGLAELEEAKEGNAVVNWCKRFEWLVFLQMLLGWGLTAIAASVGAPFWFDLLGRFVNIRAAGRPPGEKEATSTPTKPPLTTLDSMPGSRPATH